MNRLPRPGVLAALALLGAMPTAESVPTVAREPHPADALPEAFRDNPKIRAAEEKRARRAAKWRKDAAAAPSSGCECSHGQLCEGCGGGPAVIMTCAAKREGRG